jgi:hypothetical protein
VVGLRTVGSPHRQLSADNKLYLKPQFTRQIYSSLTSDLFLFR